MNDGAPGLSAAGPPPQATASILLANRPAELERMRGWLHDFLAPLGLGEDLGYRIDLTLHEAACNVIDHAWDDGGEHRFIVSITARDGEVETIIEDEGRPFAPPAHPLP